MQGKYGGIAPYIFFDYLAGAAYHNFAPLFFAEKGMSHGQVGLLTGMGPLVAIALQPLWGYWSDRSAKKNWIHLLLLCGTMGALLLYLPARGLPAMLGVAALFGCFAPSVTPLGETIVLQHLGEQGKGFGPLRVWGTAAFAVGALVTGLVMEGGRGRFPWVVTGAYLLTAGAALLLPRVPGGQQQVKGPGWKALLNRPVLLTLLALVAVLQLTQGLYFSYFALHFSVDLGGSKTLLGVAAVVASLAEIPFLLCADRLFDKFGARKLVLCAGAVMALRWTLLGMLRNVGAVIASQALNGAGLIVLTFCVVKYVQHTVPAELKGRGQMLASMITFGVGRGLVSPVGWLLSRVLPGIGLIFYVMAGLCAVAVVGIGVPLLRMQKKTNA
ncbi:MAG: MFS transporter [Clostridia bacterium]|nr:MFS transporter [Clostridia bacterium]